ncbi:hypothetical protein J26TS2_28480 [Shouchella clausii]|uniref:4'-phosphopantetheinyl transferase family protein n=1 Tax=Shouchella tritolerans TaxID=2979466 RepID=UPI000B2B4855|nr:4'-phosphopantetheinyl transferase superfamily protein [Shouchella tritolerans]GIN12981.1 hypothetical protein J26TS2_28480 [Shouchella clausii]
MDIFLLNIKASIIEFSPKINLSLRTINRLNKASHPVKRLHLLYSDLLLQYVLIKKQGIKHPLKIHYNENGKPFLLKDYFSLSHCNEWIMCAYDNKGLIGADIEAYKEYNQELAQFFFTDNELSHLLSLSPHSRNIFFLDTWTFKESYVKCKGIRLIDIMRTLNTPLTVNYFKRNCLEVNGESLYYVRGFIEGYSWCVLSEESFDYNIHLLGCSQLIDALEHY